MSRFVSSERLFALRKEPLFKTVGPRVERFNNKLFVLASRFGNTSYYGINQLLKSDSPQAKAIVILMEKALGYNKCGELKRGNLVFTKTRKNQVDLSDIQTALEYTMKALKTFSESGCKVNLLADTTSSNHVNKEELIAVAGEHFDAQKARSYLDRFLKKYTENLNTYHACRIALNEWLHKHLAPYGVTQKHVESVTSTLLRSKTPILGYDVESGVSAYPFYGLTFLSERNLRDNFPIRELTIAIPREIDAKLKVLPAKGGAEIGEEDIHLYMPFRRIDSGVRLKLSNLADALNKANDYETKQRLLDEIEETINESREKIFLNKKYKRTIPSKILKIRSQMSILRYYLMQQNIKVKEETKRGKKVPQPISLLDFWLFVSIGEAFTRTASKGEMKVEQRFIDTIQHFLRERDSRWRNVRTKEGKPFDKYTSLQTLLVTILKGVHDEVDEIYLPHSESIIHDSSQIKVVYGTFPGLIGMEKVQLPVEEWMKHSPLLSSQTRSAWVLKKNVPIPQ